MSTTLKKLRSRGVLAAATVAIMLATVTVAPAVDEFAMGVAGRIRGELRRPPSSNVAAPSGQRFPAAKRLTAFYAHRRYRPVWVANFGVLPTAAELLARIKTADQEGLDPADYHLRDIAALMADLITGGKPAAGATGFGHWARLDLLLTDAFLQYAAHLAGGRVDPRDFNAQRPPSSRRPDAAAVLKAALNSGEIGSALGSLAPPHPGYARLKEALGRYRHVAAAGGWSRIPGGDVLCPGDHSPRIPLLRRRLAASGDLQGPRNDSQSKRFSDALARALARFQRRHGLPDTGTLDALTLAALNVPLAERIRQIETNLERWRWLPRDLQRRHVLVNVADFTLAVIEDGRPVVRMRVAVGKPRSPTPVFSSRITYLVINPVWTIPPRIAREDVLPRIKADPEYLRHRKIHVFANWLADAPEIDPRTIDWKAVQPQRLVYKLQQEPGPLNELGRMKFMFPNRFAVYLHDTPDRGQFSRPRRDLSSGCIRLEKPVALATYLLRESPGWTREQIMATIDSGREMVLGLKKPIAIHLFYWTAWVDEDGVLQFRKDIYGRDTAMGRAMHRRPPARAITTAGRDQRPGGQNRF